MGAFTFTSALLRDGKLTIAGALLHEYMIFDETGKAYYAAETTYEDTEGVSGVSFAISSSAIGGATWTARTVVDEGVVQNPPDVFSFRDTDLDSNGRLFVAHAAPGDLTFVNGNGDRFMLEETETVRDGVSGVSVDFSELPNDIDDTWYANYIPASSAVMQMQYSVDGSDWHSELDEENDQYIRFSTDGGITFSPAIALNRPEQSSSSSSGDVSVPFTAGYVTRYFGNVSTGNTAIDTIINDYVLPHIWMFLEIQVHYEVGARRRDGSYKFSYANWNRGFEPEVFLNGSDTQLKPSLYKIDYDHGIITPKFSSSAGDNILCTYNFSWFRQETLASYVYRSMSTINYHGQGAVSDYTVDTLPEGLYGIAADLCVAMCMENLLLGYTMWSGKLIFSISSNDLYNGGGSDVTSQLETIKRNAEDRAYGALENENLRAPHTLMKPTSWYWRAVSIGNGLRPGPHGQTNYGKLRGWKINKMAGHVGPDIGM